MLFRSIAEVEEEDDAASLSAGKGKAATPPVAERNARVDLNPRNSGTHPLSSPPPQLAAPAPPLSSTGTSRCLPAQNPEPVVPHQKRKAESVGERQGPVKRRKKVKIPVMNLDVQENLREMGETAEKDNDEQRLKDMPFVSKALIEPGEQYGEEIVTKKVWERRAAMMCEALSLEME